MKRPLPLAWSYAVLAALIGCSPPDPEVRIVTETEVVTETHTIVETETVTQTEVVTETEVITETEVVEVEVPDDDPDPGRFEAPLTRLKQLLSGDGALGTKGGWQSHMHIDEMVYRETDSLVLYCSYTFGVFNGLTPETPKYLAQGYEWDLGSPVARKTGCLHLDWDDADPDVVYVSHRGNYDFQPHLSVVDLNSNGAVPPVLAPVQHPSLREEGASYEGLDAANGYVYVALHAGGLGVFQRDPSTNELSRVATYLGIDNAYDVQVHGDVAYVLDEYAGLYLLDVSDPQDIRELGQLYLGGVQRDLQVVGDIAWVAAGGAGLAAIDVSEPTNPSLISLTSTPSPAIRLGVDGDRLALAAWTDTRVYDISDPANPEMFAGLRLEVAKDYVGDPANERPDITARTLGVDLHGDNLFVGNWWTPYTYKIHADRPAPYLFLPEEVHLLSFGRTTLGETSQVVVPVANHGNADLTLYDIWSTNPNFEVDPPYAVIPPGGSQEITLTWTGASEGQETTFVEFLSDDPNQPWREAYGLVNAETVAVGDPFPYTEAIVAHTGEDWNSEAIAGQVTLVAYFATFCPVCGIEVADLENEFHQRYAGEGLVVLGIDADADDVANPTAVTAYTDMQGATYPILLEQSAVTPTYATLEAVYDGANPYPVDILIDRHGVMRYIAREYDPVALHAKVQELLAEP